MDKKTILIVDDNKSSIQFIKDITSNAGYSLIETTDTNKALQLIYETNISMVFIDIFMPGMENFETIIKIRNKGLSVPLIAISAMSFKQDREKAIKAGCNDFLSKPINSESLINILKKYLDNAKIKVDEKTDISQGDLPLQDIITKETLKSSELVKDSLFLDIAFTNPNETQNNIALYKKFNLSGRFGGVLANLTKNSSINANFMQILMSNWNIYQKPINLINFINNKLNNDNDPQICVSFILFDQQRKILQIVSAGNIGGIIASVKSDSSIKIYELQSNADCTGIPKQAKENFSYEKIKLNHGDYVFLFSNKIIKNDIKEALISDKSILSKEYLGDINKQLINTINSRYNNKDNIVLMAYKCLSILEKNELHYEFNTGYEGVDKACKWLESNIKQNKISKDKDLDFIIFSVREALLNAVEHGNQKDSETFIDLSLLFKQNQLRINISDEGSGFDVYQTLENCQNLDGYQVGKRGLILMDSIADTIKIFGGTVSLFFNNING